MHELMSVASGLFPAVHVLGGSLVPNPAPTAPPGLQAVANMLLGWLKWSGLVAGVVGLGICAIMMILGRRNRSNMAVDGAAGIPWVLGGLSLLSLASGLVGAVLS